MWAKSEWLALDEQPYTMVLSQASQNQRFRGVLGTDGFGVVCFLVGVIYQDVHLLDAGKLGVLMQKLLFWIVGSHWELLGFFGTKLHFFVCLTSKFRMHSRTGQQCPIPKKTITTKN